MARVLIRVDNRPFSTCRLSAFIRSILGFILFSTSYCVVNTGIYYKFVRPLRQEERELLERELIEADRAGFTVNLK
ncbi:unnamed protein product [Heligmosomoides polygyrus]|uniref:Uncharacterized protein n=1 Tax=Heligmosomoides polygyrus TaxID=6339 RepID=A0A3P7XA12_HELPZ|nr:unnamed protein product [Heligmosomoides polygyrus]